MKLSSFLWITLVIYSMASVLSACNTPSMETNCMSYSQNTDVAAQLPAYLVEVWPAPNSIIDEKCYNSSLQIEGVDLATAYRGIGVKLTTGEIDEFVKGVDFDPLPSRIKLIVDDEEITIPPHYLDGRVELVWISESVEYHSGESDAYRLSWGPILDAGEHAAHLVILSNTGREFEYRWEFKIK